MEKQAETVVAKHTVGIILEKVNLTGKMLKNLTMLSDWVTKR